MTTKYKHEHWTKGATERINFLRDQFWTYEPCVDIERAMVYTDVYKETENEDMILRRAKAFKRYMETRTINILPQELIIGSSGKAPKSFIFCPDICFGWVKDEIDTLDTRDQDPYAISEEDRETIRNYLIPYWTGKSMEEYFMANISDELRNVAVGTAVVYGENKTTVGGGETAVGFENIILKKGFKGVKEEAEANMAALDMNLVESFDKQLFYKSVILCCEAVKIQSDRYAELAEKMAAEEADSTRTEELLTIAESCRRVPWEPPRTFREAIQAIALVEVALYCDENSSGYNIGRFDQYLYDLYKADKAAGILTDLDAQELLECLWLKIAESLYGLSEAGAEFYVGYQPYHGVTLGGIDKNGEDGANELSFMGIQATIDLQMNSPTINIRVNKKNPEKFLMKIAELIACGTGQPSVHFDESAMEMLRKSGVCEQDLWNYTLVGCVSPQMAGETTQWNEGSRYSYPTAVEWALFDGYSYVFNRQMGLKTGDPCTFETYEEFAEATKKQLAYLVGCACRCSQLAERAQQIRLPKPFRDCCVEGPIKQGRDIMFAGSSKYFAGPGLLVTGIADLADSLAAVKKLVFEEKKIAMADLIEALKNNFEGNDIMRHMLITEAPKYGNDDPYVDEIAAEFCKYSCDVASEYTSIFGSHYSNGLVPVMANVPHGKAIWALPSGRKAQEPLADGMSPFPGYDKKGPTAVIKSVCAINHSENRAGTLLNLKLTPDLIATDEGKRKLIALLRSEELLGGFHVQFNVVDRNTLLKAQEHPENYSDLLVRVAGYSAFFVDLRKEAQDLIINRTEVSAW
ncbi:MAG: formate C-acetyltransferase/glycerol dehydratase family glycyl radical enzyme [Parasporobacterium sp.]|nr:formate C-acetyltransferase/glycerol dehydratase family glycyl radical enzyme [Parasporobacterium sp.]